MKNDHQIDWSKVVTVEVALLGPRETGARTARMRNYRCRVTTVSRRRRHILKCMPQLDSAGVLIAASDHSSRGRLEAVAHVPTALDHVTEEDIAVVTVDGELLSQTVYAAIAQCLFGPEKPANRTAQSDLLSLAAGCADTARKLLWALGVMGFR